jgi:hypothetical protein
MKAPSPRTTNLPSGWSYTGCFQDVSSTHPTFRDLIDYKVSIVPVKTTKFDDNDALRCIDYCADDGYLVAGASTLRK